MFNFLDLPFELLDLRGATVRPDIRLRVVIVGAIVIALLPGPRAPA